MSSRYNWDENGNIDTENVPDPFFDPLKTDVKMLLTSWDDSGNETTPYSVDLKVVGVLKEDQGKGYETSEGVMMDINALKVAHSGPDGEDRHEVRVFVHQCQGREP